MQGAWGKEEVMKAHYLENFKLRARVTAMVFLMTVSSSWAQDANGFAGLQKHINKQVTVETQSGKVSGQLLRVEETDWSCTRPAVRNLFHESR